MRFVSFSPTNLLSTVHVKVSIATAPVYDSLRRSRSPLLNCNRSVRRATFCLRLTDINYLFALNHRQRPLRHAFLY